MSWKDTLTNATNWFTEPIIDSMQAGNEKDVAPVRAEKRAPAAAPVEKVGEIDLGEYVGGTFHGVSPEGKPLFKTNEGVVEVDPKEALLGAISDNGLGQYKPEQFDVKINTPETAVPLSPLSAKDRAIFSFAQREEDYAAALKKKFGDRIVQDPDRGFLVNNNGLWQQIDPSFFEGSDPWKATKAALKAGVGLLTGQGLADSYAQYKEYLGEGANVAKAGARTLADPIRRQDTLKDLAEGGPTAIKGGLESAAAGAAGAATFGNPVAVAAAGAAGAGAGNMIVTRLGKALGVDNSSPMDEAKETAIDMFFSLGGRAVAPAARPVFQELNEAAKTFAKTATQPVKDMFAAFFGTTTQAGLPAARTLIENNAAFSKRFADIKRAVGTSNSDQIVSEAAARQVQLGKNLVESADNLLIRRYGEALDDLAAKSGKMSIRPATISQKAFQGLEAEGVGQLVVEENLPASLSKRARFKFLTAQEAVNKSGRGASEFIPEETAKKLEPLIKLITEFGNAENKSGMGAAKALNGIEKLLNNVSRSIYSSDDDAAKRIASKVLGNFKTAIGEEFEKAGLSNEWSSLAQIYAQNKDAVNWGMKQLNRVGGAEALVNDLVNSSGRRAEARGMAQHLVGLLGKHGEKLYEEIQLNNAVQKFAPWWKGSLMSYGAAGIGITGKMTGGASLPVVAAGVSQFMPRVVSTEVGAMRRLMAMLQYMGPAEIDALVKNPQAFNAAFGTALQSNDIQAAIEGQLMGNVQGALQ